MPGRFGESVLSTEARSLAARVVRMATLGAARRYRYHPMKRRRQARCGPTAICRNSQPPVGRHLVPESTRSIGDRLPRSLPAGLSLGSCEPARGFSGVCNRQPLPKISKAKASSPNPLLYCIRIPQSRFSSTVSVSETPVVPRRDVQNENRCLHHILLTSPTPSAIVVPPSRSRCSCRTLNSPPLRSHFARATRRARWHTASRARAAAYFPMPCTPTLPVSRSWLAESARHCLHPAQP